VLEVDVVLEVEVVLEVDVVLEVEVVVVVEVDVVEVEVDVVVAAVVVVLGWVVEVVDVGVEVVVGMVAVVVVTELGRVVVVVGGRGVVPEVPGNPEPPVVTVTSIRVVSGTSELLDEDSPGKVVVLSPIAAGWASEGSQSRADSRFASPSGTTADAST